jgi:hypothetical protein
VALTKVNRGGLNTGISDSSNATFLTVDSSEQAVIKSDGGAVTTSVQQGLVKSYMALNGQGTISVRGSFNATSLTDAGTGEYIYSFVNHMQNNEYVPNTELQWDENDDNKVAFSCVRKSGSALDTGQTAIGTGYAYTSLFDPLRVFGQVVGDLA